MLSIKTIKGSQAKDMAAYYAKGAEQRAKDKGISIEAARKEVREERAEEIADSIGATKKEVLQVWDAQDNTERSKASSNYYKADVSEAPDRLSRLIGDGDGPVTQQELEYMIQGRDADGSQLRDPSLQVFQRLAERCEVEGVEASKDSRELTVAEFDSLREGRNPVTGEELSGEARQYWEKHFRTTDPDKNANKVTTVDLTFSMDKSVSVLLATCDPEMREHIIAMGEEAVLRTLEHAQAEGLTPAMRGSTSGRGEERSFVEGELQKALIKKEMSSRAGDPQLHFHTLVSSAVRSEDGRITSADLQPLHKASKYLGMAFRREFEKSLTREYGFVFEHDAKGMGEIKGVDREFLKEYSKRSQEIRDFHGAVVAEENEIVALVEQEEDKFLAAVQRVSQMPKQERERDDLAESVKKDIELAKTYNRYKSIVHEREMGQTMAKRNQRAALASRDNKGELEESEQLEIWASDNRLVGLGEYIQGLADEKQKDHVVGLNRNEIKAQALYELTKNKATFTEKELRMFLMQHTSTDASLDQISKLAQEIIMDPKGGAVLVNAEGIDRVGGWALDNQAQQTFTSPEMVKILEHNEKMLDKLHSSKVAGHKVSRRDLKFMGEVAENRGYNIEQKSLLSAVASEQKVTSALGVAGAGKTYTLEGGVHCLRQKGYTTVGLSTAANTAHALEDAGTDRNYSLEKLLMDDKGGVLHDGKWKRGLSAEVMNLKTEIESEIRKVKAQIEKSDNKMYKAYLKTTQLAPAEKALEKWKQERAAEEVEWKDYQHRWDRLQKKMELYDDWKKHGDLLREYGELEEIKARNPHAKVDIDYNQRVNFLVDEAGMMSDRHMEQLLEAVTKKFPNAKITFVGDVKQLNSVETGTSFDRHVSRHGALQLTTARRPNHEWEARLQERWWGTKSLDHTSEGVVAPQDAVESRILAQEEETAKEVLGAAEEVLSTYEEHERIEYTGSEEVNAAIAEGKLDPSDTYGGAQKLMNEQLAADYLDIRDRNRTGLVMAQTHVQVAAVNKSVQASLLERGVVNPDKKEGKTIVANVEKGIEQDVYIGDQVMVRKNQGQDGARNGQVGVVTNVTARCVQVEIEGKTHTLPNKKLNEGALALGYASTIASAQGATVDEAVTVVDPSSPNADRAGIYVGMSRGRDSNRLRVLVADGSTQEKAREALVKKMVTTTRESSPLDYINRNAKAEDVIDRKRQTESVMGEKSPETLRAMAAAVDWNDGSYDFNKAEEAMEQAVEAAVSRVEEDEMVQQAELREYDQVQRKKRIELMKQQPVAAAEHAKQKAEHEAQEREDLKKGNVMVHQKVRQHAHSR